MHVIYKITSPSGKCYIGLTKDLKRRLYHHERPQSQVTALKNAIMKYSWEAMVVEVLHENLTLEEANILEALEIKNHNSLAPNGYNLHTGGDSHSVSELTRQRQREAQLGKKHSPERMEKHIAAITGRPVSAETRAKLSQSNVGQKRSAETCANIGKSKRGIKQSPEVIEQRASKIRGVPKSPEHIEKVRQANIGKIVSAETRERQRQAQLGKKRDPAAVAKVAAKLKNRSQRPEEIAARAFGKNKSIFIKELPKYNANAHLIIGDIGTVLLSSLLEIDITTVRDRISAGKFPSAYHKHPRWFIPAEDIHNYYSTGVELYGL